MKKTQMIHSYHRDKKKIKKKKREINIFNENKEKLKNNKDKTI